ncbi:MAG: SMP-30/gluconolactonase/LRE family protein [Rhizobiales bacterium]|nr:SMP-30/gluconolactonase/LRE family protein [Hyphomicrobiales bacterium]
MAGPGEPATNRLNDACTDPWGRVWFGSMDDSEGKASGRFYVFDRGEIRAAGPSGIAITNGPAVNAQGDRIYFTDTTAQKIMSPTCHLRAWVRRGLSLIRARCSPMPIPMDRWWMRKIMSGQGFTSAAEWHASRPMVSLWRPSRCPRATSPRWRSAARV